MSSQRSRAPSESQLAERTAALSTLGSTLQSHAETTQVAARHASEAIGSSLSGLDAAAAVEGTSEDTKQAIRLLHESMNRCRAALDASPL